MPLKYLFVGFMTVIIDYSAIFLFYTILDVNYILAVVIGLIFASLFQFISNFYFTFQLKHDAFFMQRVVLFCIFSAIGMGLSTITIIVIDTLLHSLYVSKTFSLVVSFLYGYTVSKKIIYKKVR